MTTVAPVRATTVVRTLLVTQFAFDVGFHAVVPFIALACTTTWPLPALPSRWPSRCATRARPYL